jgi:hypothetical protein
MKGRRSVRLAFAIGLESQGFAAARDGAFAADQA